MDLGLSGKVALVTGAGRGIGEGIAEVLAEEGATVVVNDIDESSALSRVTEIRQTGGNALAVGADVLNAEEVGKMVAIILAECGGLDILVNNVGIPPFTSSGPVQRKGFRRSTRSDWDRDINIILYSTMNCIHAVVDHMIATRRGKVINIASAAGLVGMAGLTTYSMGKAGIVGLTRSLAAELGRFGINVNAVSPGIIRAGRIAAIEEAAKGGDPEAAMMLDFDRRILSMNSLNRGGVPRNIGDAVAFLASDRSNFINGHTLCVDGGFPVNRFHYGDPDLMD